MTEIRKPPIRMKTVVKLLEQCIFVRGCTGCPYGDEYHCKDRLMCDALYYLKQTLEKSEKGK